MTLKLQRFENTFFNLVSIHHKIVDSIDFERGFMGAGPEKELKGRDVFKESHESMSIITMDLKEINESYMKSYEQLLTDFGHYFRNLYRIVKMVDEEDIVSNDSSEIHKIKYKYTSIIRAQLSDYELLWLFYNCLSSNGNKKFKPLVEKYTLFKNIPINKLHMEEHKNLYVNQAITKPKEASI
ncbi:MAG: putative phage abortive infection protein [Flavobacteriaceae bacterium]|nr:putative phage abortive infection protein [Flavobacteriaceae bacterium]